MKKQYRAFYIPQVPMTPFYIYTDTLEESIKLLATIIQFSIFEFNNNIKPDYSDASGIDFFETDTSYLDKGDPDITEYQGQTGIWEGVDDTEEGESVDDLIDKILYTI